MNRQTRWLVAFVVALIMANIGLVAYLWLKKEAPKQVLPRSDARAYLVQTLALSTAQTASFDSLREGHFERMRNYKDAMRLAKDSLFEGLRQPQAKNAERLTQRIGALQARMDLETFDHFAQLRALLSPAQAEIFDNVIGDVLRTMGPRRGGPPPGGERREGPPHGEGRPHDGPPEDEGPPPGEGLPR